MNAEAARYVNRARAGCFKYNERPVLWCRGPSSATAKALSAHPACPAYPLLVPAPLPPLLLNVPESPPKPRQDNGQLRRLVQDAIYGGRAARNTEWTATMSEAAQGPWVRLLPLTGQSSFAVDRTDVRVTQEEPTTSRARARRPAERHPTTTNDRKPPRTNTERVRAPTRTAG